MLTKNDFLCSHKKNKPHIGHTKNERRQVTTTIHIYIYIERGKRWHTCVAPHMCFLSHESAPAVGLVAACPVAVPKRIPEVLILCKS